MWCNVDIFNQKKIQRRELKKKIAEFDGSSFVMDLTTLKLSHNVAIVVRPSFTINFKMYRRRHTPIPCMYECGRLYAIAREWDDDESEEKKTHTATGQFKLSTVVVQKKKNYIHSHTTKQRKLSQYKHRLNELSALYHYTRAALCTHTNALTHTQHPSHNTLELPSKRKNVSGSVALNIISIKIV